MDDLIEGMIRLLNSDTTGPINIGNTCEFTIRQLAELVRNSLQPNLPLISKPLRQDDPIQRQPLIDLAKKELDWEPLIQLEDGLTRTIDWFREHLGSN